MRTAEISDVGITETSGGQEKCAFEITVQPGTALAISPAAYRFEPST
jgi:hypothetical protein